MEHGLTIVRVLRLGEKMIDRLIPAPIKAGQAKTVKLIAVQCPTWFNCKGNCPERVKDWSKRCLVWVLKE